MELLAISGGPDSMLLLDDYKNKKIVVAHVNYNKRTDSIIDQNIVENFCKTHQIPFELLDLKDLNHTANFQDWARTERYDFFTKIYNKYDCKKLLVAHHKDDFLETAIMQIESKRKPSQFGIAQENFLYGMKIFRPYLNLYWKDEILKIILKRKIKFAIDSSNQLPVYTRNKIRLRLSHLNLKKKEEKYQWFIDANKSLKKINQKINHEYRKWTQKDFFIKDFSKYQYQDELIFKFIHQHHPKIKLSQKKIISIIAFITAEKGNIEYIIKNNVVILKKNKKIKIINKSLI